MFSDLLQIDSGFSRLCCVISANEQGQIYNYTFSSLHYFIMCNLAYHMEQAWCCINIPKYGSYHTINNTFFKVWIIYKSP